MQEVTDQINSIENHIDRYEKLEEHLHGTTADVYKVADENGDIFCLKVYHDKCAEIFPGEVYLKERHLINEHIPHVAKVYAVNKYRKGGKDVHYSIMEYVNGISLFDYMNAGQYDSHFVEQLASRMYEANKRLLKMNLAHRDMTVFNILVADDGATVLIDFGHISRNDTVDLTKKEKDFFYEELAEIIDLPKRLDSDKMPLYWNMITLFKIKRVVNDVIIKKKGAVTYRDIKAYLNLEYEIRLLTCGNKPHVAMFKTCMSFFKVLRRVYLKMLYFS